MNPVTEVRMDAMAEGDAPVRASVLLDVAAVKIVAIRVRRGAVLPEHTAAAPVVIQATRGRGTLRADGSDHPLSAGQFVVLAANVVHSVTAVGDEDLVLTVQHLRGAAR